MVDLNSIELLDEAPAANYDPLPNGWYGAEIIESDDPTSAAGNRYLSFTFQVNDDGGAGQYIGRRVWANFNLFHSKENVTLIAQEQYSNLVRALKLTAVGDSYEMHGIPVDIKLTTEEGRGGYGPKNKIQAFRTSTGAATPPAKAGNGSSNGRPWET